MSKQNFSVISLLLILALLCSTLAVVVTPAAVRAATQSIVIYTPNATANITYVMPGGTVTCNITRTDPLSTSASVKYQVWSSTLGSIYEQNLPTDNGSANKSFSISSIAQQGWYNLTVTAQDNLTPPPAALPAVQLNSIYVDSTPPTVTLYSPAAGACWNGNAAQSIWFTPYDAASGDNVTISIDLSYTGAAPYSTSILSSASKQQVYQQYVTGTLTAATYCQLRITAVDRAGNTSYTYSGLFSISTTAPAVTVTSPINGDIWNGGTQHHITATITGSGTTIYYKVGLFKTSSNTENFTSAWVPVTLGGGYLLDYLWTVSNNTRGNDFQIGVFAKDCAGNESVGKSAASFTIKDVTPPTCSVSIPNSSTSWYAGSSENITFNCTDNVPGFNVTSTFSYSTNGGADNYPYTIGSTTGAQGLNKVYLWTIPSTLSSTNCKIKQVCSDLETPANSCTSYSNAFTVLPPCTAVPSVTLCSPVGGESWPVGSLQNITWTASDSSGSTTRLRYTIQLSTDGGSTWTAYPPNPIYDQSNQPQYPSCTGSYSWAVSDNQSSNALIRITATNPCGYTAVSQSTYPFSITPGSACPVLTGTVTLCPNWNLISLPLIPTNTAINSVMATVPNVISVWYFTGGTTGVWTSWAPGAPSSLTTMEDGKAYWVNMSAAGTLTFQGRKAYCPPAFPPTPQYSVPAGWNMVGFKSTINKPVTSYLPGGLTNCGVTYNIPVYGFDCLTQQYISKYCTDNLTTGSGYWVLFNTAATIIGGTD